MGWQRGGLGHVDAVGAVIFAGMSGTAMAGAGGPGTIEIKAMRDHGCADDFPVGMALSGLSPVANISFDRTVMAALPFLIPLFVAPILITLFAGLTLYVPIQFYR